MSLRTGISTAAGDEKSINRDVNHMAQILADRRASDNLPSRSRLKIFKSSRKLIESTGWSCTPSFEAARSTSGFFLAACRPHLVFDASLLQLQYSASQPKTSAMLCQGYHTVRRIPLRAHSYDLTVCPSRGIQYGC